MEGNTTGETKFCSNCGAAIDKKAVICPKCGVKQSTGGSGDKQKVPAGILGILLGGFGAHKFYLNQTGVGILYLCFCWTGIPSLIGLVEGIIYLTMSDEDFDSKYN